MQGDEFCDDEANNVSLLGSREMNKQIISSIRTSERSDLFIQATQMGKISSNMGDNSFIRVFIE